MDSIYEAKWEELLPDELKKDKRILALVTAIAEQKRKIAQEIWRVIIWPNFDGVSEEMAEVLRHDLGISADEFQGSIEDKRRMLKMARSMRKNAGTASAVVDAILTVYPNGNPDVLEWFDYGGEPYGFTPVIDVTGADVRAETLEKTVARINAAKNVRSWLDWVKLTTNGKQSTKLYVGGIIRRKRIAKIQDINGSVSEMPYLADEDDMPLADETGMMLFEG